MAQVVITAGADPSTGNTPGVSRYLPAGETYFDTNLSIESRAQVTFRTPGVWSLLYCRVLTNTITATTTVRSRVNAANGNQVISIASSTTGQFEDTSNTDTISAGDELNYQWVVGGSGTAIGFVCLSSVFTATTSTVKRLVTFPDSFFALTAASTDSFSNISGISYGGLGLGETRNQYTFRTAATLSNGFANITTNGRSTASTIKSRINGADGNISISITASTTGFFEDTSNSDTIASGDNVAWKITTGTGTGSLTPSIIALDFTTTNNSFPILCLATNGVLANNTTSRYQFIGGASGNQSTTEANNQSKVRFDFTASNFFVSLGSNNRNGTSSATVRLGGAATALTVSIPATTSGKFEDTSNSVSVVATDLLDYQLTPGGTLSSMTVDGFGMLGATPVTSTQNNYLIMF